MKTETINLVNHVNPVLRICSDCGLYKAHLARGMCKSCYALWIKAQHRGTCPRCGKENLLIWKGRCETCYQQERPQTARLCAVCGQIKMLKGRNRMCGPCYEHDRRRARQNGRVARFSHQMAKALRRAAIVRGLTTTQLVIEICEVWLMEHR